MSMLSVNDLKPGVFFILHGQPHVILEAHHLKMQQRRPVMQTRFRNLITGKILEHNFQQSDELQGTEILKKTVRFLYNHRDEFWFSEIHHPGERFKLGESLIGDAVRFLKPNTEVTALQFENKIINVELPIKVDLRVIHSPPAVRGDTATGGSKMIKVETGAEIKTPLFIQQDDVIRINTKTGEYVERVNKK